MTVPAIAPGSIPVQVALIEHGDRAHCGLDRRVLAVLLYEDLGGAGVKLGAAVTQTPTREDRSRHQRQNRRMRQTLEQLADGDPAKLAALRTVLGAKDTFDA